MKNSMPKFWKIWSSGSRHKLNSKSGRRLPKCGDKGTVLLFPQTAEAVVSVVALVALISVAPSAGLIFVC